MYLDILLQKLLFFNFLGKIIKNRPRGETGYHNWLRTSRSGFESWRGHIKIYSDEVVINFLPSLDENPSPNRDRVATRAAMPSGNSSNPGEGTLNFVQCKS